MAGTGLTATAASAAPATDATSAFGVSAEESTSPSTDAATLERVGAELAAARQRDVRPGYDGRAVQNNGLRLTLPGQAQTMRSARHAGVPAQRLAGRGATLAQHESNGALVTSYATDAGVRTLIEVPDAAAPEVYSFQVDVPAGAMMTKTAKGAVNIVSPEGSVLGGFHAPWAYDASGVPVKTELNVVGNTLVQTIAPTSATVFPVTADPDGWWGWTVCAATFAAVFAPWGKAASIGYKIVKRFGSIKRAAEIVYRAYKVYGTFSKTMAALKAQFGYLIVEILGVKDIQDACFS